MATYAGETAAERVARRRAALVEAAFALMAADGGAGLRIERVCAEAGLNKRYFYESFADVDGVTVAVIDRLVEETVAATLSGLDHDAPLEAFVRTGVAALVDHLVADERRARVLFGELAVSPAAARRRANAIHTLATIAIAQGRAIRRLRADADPVVDLAGAMLIGGTRQAVLDFLDGRLHAGRDTFVDDLSRLWIALSDAAR